MAEIHTLCKDGKSIYPITHISAVVDDNGNTITEILPTKISQLENDSGYITEIPDTIASKEYVESAITSLDTSEIYYLELPVDENGQYLSEGSLTQEQFENILNCSILKVKTFNQSVETASITENIIFNWDLTQIEQYEDGTFSAKGYSSLYTNLAENCFSLYVFTIGNYAESEYTYGLLKKRIFLDSEILDPSDVYLSTNSVYELNISSDTEFGEISEEEFNRIVSSKILILNMGMHKIVCIQRTAPEVYPDTYYFYGNFFDSAEQKILLSLLRKDGVCIYKIQTEEISSGSSGGVPIVNSESSLDPNAEAGSLAVVSEEKIHSFGEIGTYAEMSYSDGSITNESELTKIQGLSFQSVTTLPNDITTGIVLVSEDFSYASAGIMLAIQIGEGAVTLMRASFTSGEPESFSLWDPTSGYNQETIDLIETTMLGKIWYFLGSLNGTALSDEEVQVIDQLVKFKETSTTLYIKRDNWVTLETKGKKQINREETNYVNTILAPNIFYVWGKVSNLNIQLAPETSGIINEYLFQFTSGETATSLTFPTDIKWTNEPVILPNKTYQISILNGLGSILQFDV